MVIGPIANDTIFDTFGIITSGVLAPKESMQLLMIGPKYEQIALKSEKAAAQLKWLGGRVLSKDEVARYRAVEVAGQARSEQGRDGAVSGGRRGGTGRVPEAVCRGNVEAVTRSPD